MVFLILSSCGHRAIKSRGLPNPNWFRVQMVEPNVIESLSLRDPKIKYKLHLIAPLAPCCFPLEHHTPAIQEMSNSTPATKKEHDVRLSELIFSSTRMVTKVSRLSWHLTLFFFEFCLYWRDMFFIHWM